MAYDIDPQDPDFFYSDPWTDSAEAAAGTALHRDDPEGALHGFPLDAYRDSDAYLTSLASDDLIDRLSAAMDMGVAA